MTELTLKRVALEECEDHKDYLIVWHGCYEVALFGEEGGWWTIYARARFRATDPAITAIYELPQIDELTAESTEGE